MKRKNFILRYKYLILILLLISIVISYFGLQRISVDSSNEILLPENDPVIIKNDKFKEIFGNNEFIFILIENQNLFSSEVLNYIRELTVDLEKNLPFVDEVTSLTNLDYIESENNTLKVDELIGDKIPTAQEKLRKIRSKVLSKDNYVGNIITKDAGATGIVVTFKEIPKSIYAGVSKDFSPLAQVDYPAEKVLLAEDLNSNSEPKLNKIEDPRKLIAPVLRVILNRHQQAEVKTTATGVALLDFEADRLVYQEGSRFGLLALIASVILMYLLFRNIRAVVGPFLVILVAMIVLFGILGWLNLKLSILAVIIPTLVLVISVSYSIHVINHFQYQFKKTGERIQAVNYAYQESARPIFITALTTALGFVSFVFVPMEPVKVVGIACAVGAFLTYLLVMTIIPIILSLGKNNIKYSQGSLQILPVSKVERIMEKWAGFVDISKKKTVFLTIILICLLGFFSLQLPVNSDMLQMLGDDLPFVKDANYITDRLGTLYSYDVFLEFSEENMVKKSQVLKEMTELERMISDLDSTIRVSSITDLIQELNQVMHDNQKAYDKIPDSDNLIAQYLLLYEMSGGEDLEEMVDFSYQKTHISVQINQFRGSIQKDFEKIASYVEKHFPSGTEVTVVGDIPILFKALQRLMNGQIISIGIALGIITLVMIAVLKSIKLGLLSMIPNLVPVLTITGLMGLLNYPLDLMTILVAPMIIGIAVDDTVHYFIHFQEEYHLSKSYQQSNRETFVKIGKALVSTSIVLILGFAIFGFSRMASMGHMAVLAAAGILSALIADMLITPALILLWEPVLKTENTKEEKTDAI